MAEPAQATRRHQAWKFARAAIKAYERDQSLNSSRQVELAMRLLRESQDESLRQETTEPKNAA